MGIMEKKMITTIPVTKKKMETTKMYWGYAGDNAEENGNNHSLLGLYGEAFRGTDPKALPLQNLSLSFTELWV